MCLDTSGASTGRKICCAADQGCASCPARTGYTPPDICCEPGFGCVFDENPDPNDSTKPVGYRCARAAVSSTCRVMRLNAVPRSPACIDLELGWCCSADVRTCIAPHRAKSTRTRHAAAPAAKMALRQPATPSTSPATSRTNADAPAHQRVGVRLLELNVCSRHHYLPACAS